MSSKKKQQISKDRILQIQSFLKRINIKDSEKRFCNEIHPERLEKIDEALTHTSAHLAKNHERLEFLGDAVLRLAASEFIDKKFSAMNVGERSELRSQLVSDRWLAQVGKEIHIQEVLITGPKAIGDTSARETLQAEATEALIGALYQCFDDLDAIHSWLRPHWEKASLVFLDDPSQQNPKSALQEWSQAKDKELPKYQSQEQSKEHGNQKRFFCTVHLQGKLMGEGYGGSRQEAEKAAARIAIKKIEKESKNSPNKKY